MAKKRGASKIGVVGKATGVGKPIVVPALALKSKAKSGEKTVGSLSFLFGVAIAIITGLVNPSSTSASLVSLLILLGIVVGLLNITTRETNSFLMATVSLVIVSALGGSVLSHVSLIGVYLEGILLSILTFVIPATIMVALKSLYSLAETQ